MLVSVDHRAPTPLGCEVEVIVTVAVVDGRKVTLAARVRDAVEVVGTGVHVRYVIDVPRQARRIEEKKKLLESKV